MAVGVEEEHPPKKRWRPRQTGARRVQSPAYLARESAESAREAGRRGEQRKSSFLANMSHNLAHTPQRHHGYQRMLQEEAEDL